MDKYGVKTDEELVEATALGALRRTGAMAQPGTCPRCRRPMSPPESERDTKRCETCGTAPFER